MKIVDNPCSDFIEELSSKASVPGGGGAAALDGAMGAALLSMVCNLTLGKKKYAQYTEKLTDILNNAGKLKEEFLNMVDEDAENFLPLSKAYGMPKNTEEERLKKEEVLDKCLKAACSVPIKVVKKAYDTILLHEAVVDNCSELVLSDIGVGVQCLKSALAGGYLNIIINIKYIKDCEYTDMVKSEVLPLVEKGSEIAEKVYKRVVEKLSK
ncbi:formiminotetrahydrofolate cyclodeaminase [Clostridium algifaecis]|uniref:Formiminotetrahydrofolate cyclodeaminase n=1 Tax=Clostridium algifaecis TaxID=1472040 RepID=A0ABS4KSZ2_9CLOT|nr:cyclodeaminase/cyclohydrolase family protein [Clostridium algifaecis]MBP2033164.1 formiminotetrahydrofolate cyclodeaminase [Clostridium algifaecis]